MARARRMTDDTAKPLWRVVFAAVTALLGCFFFWPLAESLRGAFLTPSGEFTLAYFALLFDNPTYVEGFRNALGGGRRGDRVASLVGIAVAVAVDRWSFPGKTLLSAFIPLPLIVPPFVGALGIKQVLGQTGALNALLIDVGRAGRRASHRLAAARAVSRRGAPDGDASLPCRVFQRLGGAHARRARKWKRPRRTSAPRACAGSSR